MSLEQLKKTASKDVNDFLRIAYNIGYKKGMQKAMDAIREKNDGVTTLVEATEEQEQKWSYCNLKAWCEKCEKGISGWWGMIDFCPYCGRMIDRTERESSDG